MKTHAHLNLSSLFLVEKTDQTLFVKVRAEFRARLKQSVHHFLARSSTRINQMDRDIGFRCAGASGKFRLVGCGQRTVESFEISAVLGVHKIHDITVVVIVQAIFITLLVHLPFRYMVA